MLDKKYLLSALAGATVVAGIGAAAISFADTTPTASTATTQPTHQPGVGGTVTAVSGNTITVTAQDGKTYTIDASSATITKDETVGVSDIKVGDTIGAQGTVSGTSVTATNIHDGKMPMMMGFGGRGPGGMGRGIHGTVASVSGNTLTVTATNPKDNTTSTYIVDASSATVLKGDGTIKPATSSLSAVAVGDEVMVDGTISGTNVTAKMLVDGPMPKWGPRDQQGSTTSSSSTATQ